MKKFLTAMFAFVAVFALTFTFVGCKNKNQEPANQEASGLTESDVVGTYATSQVVLTFEGAEESTTYSQDDYEALEAGQIKSILEGMWGTYEVKSDKTVVETTDPEDPLVIADWEIENNSITFTPRDPEEETTGSVKSVTRDGNGNLVVTIEYVSEVPEYSFTAVMTLTKNA